MLIHFYAASPGKSYVYGKVVRYGRSRSFKVIEISTNRKPRCNFLLLFHCNYTSILYRFRDVTIYWSKICVFRRLSHVSFEAVARGVPET